MAKASITVALKLHPIHCAIMCMWMAAVTYGAFNIAMFGGHPDDFVQAHKEALVTYYMGNVDMVVE